MRGAGDHFSSGHDLGTPAEVAEFRQIFGREHKGRDPPAKKQWPDRYRWDVQSCLRLREISKPTIAMVQGYCIFHGWALASVMDVIFVSEDTMIMPTFLEFFDLPWRIGSRFAKELLFSGPTFLTGKQALKMGLVNRCLPRKKLEHAVLEYAKKVAKKDSWTLRMMKATCNQIDSQKGYEAYVKGALSNWVHMSQAMPPRKEGQKNLIGKENQEALREMAKKISKL